MTLKSFIVSIGIAVVMVGSFFVYDHLKSPGGMIVGNQYVDRSLGYEFTIPEGWVINTESTGLVSFENLDKTAVVGVTVEPTFKTSQDYATSVWNKLLQKTKAQGEMSKFKESEDTLNGHPAKKIEYEINWDGTPVVFVVYITTYRGIGYTASGMVYKDRASTLKRTIDSFFSSVTLTELD